MSSHRASIAGEGATAAQVQAAGNHQTNWIAFPLTFAAGTMLAPSAYHEIYRLAYERAREAARPSRYEMAMRACPN